MAENSEKQQYKQYLESRLDRLTNDLSVLKERLDTFSSTDAGVMRQRLAALDIQIENLQLVEILERENHLRSFCVNLKKEIENVLRGSGALAQGEHLETELEDGKRGTSAPGSDSDGRNRFLSALAETKRESAREDGQRAVNNGV